MIITTKDDDLQVMIIDLVTALENDDDTYISSATTFWDMILDIQNKIPKENNEAYGYICHIIYELSFYSDQEEIIKELKKIYRSIYDKDI